MATLLVGSDADRSEGIRGALEVVDCGSAWPFAVPSGNADGERLPSGESSGAPDTSSGEEAMSDQATDARSMSRESVYVGCGQGRARCVTLCAVLSEQKFALMAYMRGKEWPYAIN